MSILKELIVDLKDNLKRAGYEVDTLAIEPSNRRDLGDTYAPRPAALR